MKDLPTYAWPVAIAMIVLALIQLVKSDKVPITIPPKARPWVALALGILGGTAAAIIAGRTLVEALVTGITGGTGSIGLFELGSSMKPGAPPPKPPSEQERPTDPPADVEPFKPGGALRSSGVYAIIGAIALLVLGCTDPIPAARFALGEASTVQIQAAAKLDDVCGRPMELLALEPPGNDRTVRARALAAKCDKPEAAYDAVRTAHLTAIDLLERAGTDEGVTVGALLDAIKALTEKAHAFAALVEELDR